jgi:hypothetical protein
VLVEEVPLNVAITQLSHNNNVAACNQLNAFLNQINAKQNSGQLTSQQATDLSQQAKAIRQTIVNTHMKYEMESFFRLWIFDINNITIPHSNSRQTRVASCKEPPTTTGHDHVAFAGPYVVDCAR